MAVIGLVMYPVGLVLSDWLTGHSATKHAHMVGVSNRQNSYLFKFDSLLYFPHILPFNVAFINKHPTKLLIMQVWKKLSAVAINEHERDKSYLMVSKT